MICEKAYAKINLALEVMDEINGYHKVNNIMVPISLYDEIILTKSNEIYVENDFIEDNICIKAAKLFLEEFCINSGVCIKINKNIPQAAGLAGGSTDAAAVLRGLNKLFDINATNDKLRDLAMKLGSDVPFFIESISSLCTNRGEIVNFIENNLKDVKVLLINPKMELSTKLVYDNYIYNNIDRTKEIFNILKALKNNDLELLDKYIFNDLQDVSISLCNELKVVFNKLQSEGFNPRVSGSGPTIFILNPTSNDISRINTLFKENTIMLEAFIK